VLAIQFVLAKLWQESQHPLIDLLKQTPSSGFFLLSSFTAVVAAPIVEEFFFRVLLQGWLENVAAVLRQQRRGDVVSPALPSAVFLGLPRVEGTEPPWDCGGPDGVAESTTAADAVATHRLIHRHSQLDLRPEWWPIVVSAALFALAHWGNGPDPIPLFLFALGLGYVYQRTHRVWPCILVHMLLNGFSMSQLWLYTQIQGP